MPHKIEYWRFSSEMALPPTAGRAALKIFPVLLKSCPTLFDSWGQSETPLLPVHRGLKGLVMEPKRQPRACQEGLTPQELEELAAPSLLPGTTPRLTFSDRRVCYWMEKRTAKSNSYRENKENTAPAHAGSHQSQ